MVSGIEKTIEAFLHLFYPRYSNNHKAKVLHPSSLMIIALFLVASQLFIQTITLTGVRILGYASNIPPDRIIALVNQKRAENGLSALSQNGSLASAARAKGDHMLANDYWAHVAPDGTEPWFFFTQAGYKYKYAGENLARDFSSPESAVEAWMASSSHKDNILSSKYSETGVAVVEGDLAGADTTIIVQLFGTQLSSTASQVTSVKAQAQATPTPAPTNVPLTPTVTPTSTLVPTLTPVLMVSPAPSQFISQGEVGLSKKTTAPTIKTLFSPFDATRGVSIFTIIFLLIIMAIDVIVVAKRRIPRVSGRTLAHIAFLGTILALIIIAKVGEII